MQSDHAQLPIGEIIERVEIWHAKANRPGELSAFAAFGSALIA